MSLHLSEQDLKRYEIVTFRRPTFWRWRFISGTAFRVRPRPAKIRRFRNF